MGRGTMGIGYTMVSGKTDKSLGMARYMRTRTTRLYVIKATGIAAGATGLGKYTTLISN
jgi:hypothetical protein